MKPGIQIYSDINNNKDNLFPFTNKIKANIALKFIKQIQVTILLKKHYGNKFQLAQ